MDALPLLLVLHGHLPAGEPEAAFAQAWEQHWSRALAALEQAPDLRAAWHLSGPAWEHLLEHQPEALPRLKALVDRAQLELLGGAFYAPLLSALPDWDAQGQLARTQEFLAEHLGTPARGALLPESVWEPDLPRLLAPAGYRFLVLPGEAFAGAGLFGPRRPGYHAVERAGQALAAFPADSGLAELLAAGNVDALLAELQSAAPPEAPGGRGLCLAISMQRLPEGALPALARALAGAEQVEPLPPSEYLARYPAQGRLALPGWAPDGHRASLARPEARALHLRMLHAAKKLLEAEGERGVGAGALAQARQALHRGQAHLDPARVDLRQAAYASLIAAENAVDAELRGEGDFIEYEEDDLDLDLRDEALLANAHLLALVDPDQGGALWQLDDRDRAVSLAHLAGRRLCFVDRFHPPGLGLEAVQAGAEPDAGDFAHQPYQVEASGVDEEGDLSASITLVREASVRTEQGPRALLVEKTYCLPIDAPRLEVEYILENQGQAPLPLVFAPELTLHLPGAHDQSARYALEGERQVSARARENLGVRREVVILDGRAGQRLTVSADADFEAWTYPVESGPEYQCTCLVLRLPVTLPPGESMRVRVGLQVEGLD